MTVYTRSATARDWEADFLRWAKPPSDTEQEKCSNAERMVKKAIAASEALRARKTETFAQGSHRNRTNVRLESDVDICVRCMDVWYPDYSLTTGLTNERLGHADVSYSYAQFKNEVGAALVAVFGAGVKRGNKAFNIHENTYRVNADVVAAFEHRFYTTQKANGGYLYHSGTQFFADDGTKVVNWPHQNYQNGVAKNDRTGQRFKGMVRVLKSLACEMVDEEIAAAKPIPSYLAECLVYNVPDKYFNQSTYSADVRAMLAHLFLNTRTVDECGTWTEVNEIKYLFGAHQGWTRQQAHEFISACWDYVGYK